jgi:c-di-GMP-binding flagellar brake protein YcgR
MKVQLVSCDAPKPDRRAIIKMFEEVVGQSNNEARENTDILLDGTAVEVEILGKGVESAFRSFRKLGMDYVILEE